MLVNDALSLIRVSYTKYLRRQFAVTETQSSPSSVSRRMPRFMPLDSDTRRLICLLAADQCLAADELDRIIEHLQLRRRSLVTDNNDTEGNFVHESSNRNSNDMFVGDRNHVSEVSSVDDSSPIYADKAVTQQIPITSINDAASDMSSDLRSNQYRESPIQQQTADIISQSAADEARTEAVVTSISCSSEIEEIGMSSMKANTKKVDSTAGQNEGTGLTLHSEVTESGEQVFEAPAGGHLSRFDSKQSGAGDEVIRVTHHVPSADLISPHNKCQVIDIHDSDNDCLIISVDKSPCDVAVDESLKQPAAERAIAVSRQNKEDVSSQNEVIASSQFTFNCKSSSEKPSVALSSVGQSGSVGHTSANIYGNDDKKSASDNKKTVIQKNDIGMAHTTKFTWNSQIWNSAISVMSKSTCSVTPARSGSSVSTQPASAKTSTPASSILSKSSVSVTAVNGSSVSTMSVLTTTVSSKPSVLATVAKSKSPIASSHDPHISSISSTRTSSVSSVAMTLTSCMSPTPSIFASPKSSVADTVVASARSVSSSSELSISVAQSSSKSNVSLTPDPLKSSISSTSVQPVTSVEATAVSSVSATPFLSGSSVSTTFSDLASGNVQQNNTGPKSVMDSIRAFSAWRKGSAAGEVRTVNNRARPRGPCLTTSRVAVSGGARPINSGIIAGNFRLSRSNTDVKTAESNTDAGSTGKRPTDLRSRTVSSIDVTTVGICSTTNVASISAVSSTVQSESGKSLEKSTAPSACPSAAVSSNVTVNTDGSSSSNSSIRNIVVSTSVCVASSCILSSSSSVSG
jgi:hypothetical protein